jgi:hypothetical protein
MQSIFLNAPENFPAQRAEVRRFPYESPAMRVIISLSKPKRGNTKQMLLNSSPL